MINMLDLILSIIFSTLIMLHASWIAIFLYPKKSNFERGYSPDISIIIPAHNEEEPIEKTIASVLEAEYPGNREVLVINDGSTDKTEEIVKKIAAKDSRVRLYETKHIGKAGAINYGAEKSVNDIIVTLDADSYIEKDALKKIVQPFSESGVGGVSGVVRAIYSRNPLTWFQDFEYIQSSAWRLICNKVNATYIFPGFAAFRRGAFEKVEGYSRDTYSEDFEIGLKLKKAGYKLRMSKATMYTKVPETLRGLAKQRMRWGRGTVQVMKKHSDVILNKKFGLVGLYGIPTQMYWFIHGFVYIPILVYQVSEGYYRFFASKDIFISLDVVKFFFSWFSVYGTVEYAYNTFQGAYEMNTVFILLVIMFSLYLIYNLLVLTRFSKPYPRFLFAIFFFFPYSLLSLSLHVLPLISETIRPRKTNIWEKSQ